MKTLIFVAGLFFIASNAFAESYIQLQIKKLELQRSWIEQSSKYGALKNEPELCQLFVEQFNDSRNSLPVDQMSIPLLDVQICEQNRII